MRPRRTFKVWLGHLLLNIFLTLVAILFCTAVFFTLLNFATMAAKTR